MANFLSSTGFTFEEVAGAEIAPGTFAFTAAGTAKFYGGKGTDSQNVASGDDVSASVGGIVVAFEKDDATDTYVQGATVYGDATAQTALTAGGDGTLGLAAKASANGDTHVYVLLNGV